MTEIDDKTALLKECGPESMRGLPLGISDFKRIRDSDVYYVDKTELIDQIVSYSRYESVFLFTRPRRFGKTLNLSMLNAYFNEKYKENTWFDDLKISSLRPDDPLKNNSIVISMTLKSLMTDSYESFISSFKHLIQNTYNEFYYLIESDKLNKFDKLQFNKILDSDDWNPTYTLSDLCKLLEQDSGRKVILLIDEYDNPVNQTTGEIRRRILDCIGPFLSSTLKDNDSLAFAVLTGIMQIAKENVFSGLNNLSVNNIFSNRSGEMFGFTPEEIMDICKEHECLDKYDEIREWYDGYRFGSADIYNPWSVISYIKEGFVAKSYWALTSGNSIIDDLLTRADNKIVHDLGLLGEGVALTKTIDSRITYSELQSSTEALYSIMAMTGYLKAIPLETEGDCLVSIPNKEMRIVFSKHIMKHLNPNTSFGIEAFKNAVLSGDSEKMTEQLTRFSMNTVSVRLSKDHTAYQMFIAGMMMGMDGMYRITADMESGSGYHDLRMEKIRGNGPNIIMEFKDTDSGSEKSLAEAALKQIHDRQYYFGMTGKTLLYGICIKNKVPTIISERLDL